MNHAGRMEALRHRLAAADLGALVVSAAANVRYLCGYVGSNGLLIVGHDDAVLVTDSRYAVSAREQVAGARVHIGARDLMGDVAREARALAAGGAIGVEGETVTLGWHQRFSARLAGAPVRATEGEVEALRVRKEPAELAAIRRAAAVTDRALADVLEAGIVGRSEAAVAFDLQGAVLAHGGEGLSFPTIVAAGPRGARPHAVPGNDPIGPDTLVVIDMGCIVDGYCSDMTRTVATGPLSAAVGELYSICLDAQLAALAAVGPEAVTGAIDAVARDHIAAAGHGEHFGHGLGHGVGLEIHEAPGVRPRSETVLEAGMVITIEPGIYVEGLAGVRIEDLVIVTDGGHEIVSTTPKELRVVA